MAKPFRLQALLEHKQRQEERQMLDLAARDAERRHACDILDTLRDAEREHLDHADGRAQAATFDALEQRDAVAYLARLEASIAVQHTVIAEAEEHVRESRDALVAILKEKQALERLRERHAAEAALEDGRREARVTDEITSARYARQLQERV